jgi:hypothetical protein
MKRIIDFSNAVVAVTDDRKAIRYSISKDHPDLVALLNTPAASRCVAFREENSPTAIHAASDSMQIRRFGGQMLMGLAALQSPDQCRQEEHLNLLGARGSAAHNHLRPQRRRLAALSREKPLSNMQWYVENHLRDVQQRLADELQALVEHPELLEEALCRNGRRVLVRHLS